MLKYGWIKSERESKQKHEFMALPIPVVIDLSKNASVVINQLQVGRCTGCGIGGALSSTLTALGLNPSKSFYFSPDDIYNGERVIEGTLTEDVGGQPVDGYEWIELHGVLPYSVMPITPKLNETNPLVYESQTIQLAGFQGVQIPSSGDIVASVLDALAAGHYVTQGAAFFSAWESIGGNGIVPLQHDYDPVAGGHETYYIGANQTTQLFEMTNSWGTAYGKGGHYFMPFAQLPILAGMVGSIDLHYPVFTGIIPVPTPPQPVKKKCHLFALLEQMRYNHGETRVEGVCYV